MIKTRNDLRVLAKSNLFSRHPEFDGQPPRHHDASPADGEIQVHRAVGHEWIRHEDVSHGGEAQAALQ